MSSADTHDIDYLLDEVITLPSLPTTVANLTELVNDPACSLSMVGKVIGTDPALAIKSLRLVNSAYYGLREKITSVEHAVVLLGPKVVKNLVFTAAVFDTLSEGEESLLRHSVACGVVMRTLVDSGASKVRFAKPEESFVFGLLHDVGKIIFQQFMATEYGQVILLSETRQMPRVQAEREILGVDHAELGARLAIKWKLPGELASGIEGHHDMSRCPNEAHKGLAALLCITDNICHASGLGCENDVAPPVPPEAWEITGLDGRAIVQVLDRFFESVKDIDELVALA